MKSIKTVLRVFACVMPSILMAVLAGRAVAGFRVKPYLLEPQRYGVTVVWFSDEDVPGTLTVNIQNETIHLNSEPTRADALTYADAELDLLEADVKTEAPYKHVVRLFKLSSGERVPYTVRQGDETFSGTLMAGPLPYQSARFIVFADCETEPESTGKASDWPEPGGDPDRVYVVDQTEGFKQNLLVIKQRKPGFLAFAGDIAESGGEQRDWDELWRHMNGDLGDIAGSVPIVAAPGNHDSYGGPGDFGRYEPQAHLRAINKYRAYFKTDESEAAGSHDYHRLDYGPITLLSLDSTNGQPDRTDKDTNWNLAGRDADHDFNPGSAQYRWLEQQLADAQKHSVFTFVQFHHTPYSVGPHGFIAGDHGHDHGQDTNSGVPMRALTELFMKYGVDAVFGGHDEMYEHSVVPDGVEQLPGGGGETRPHTLHIFDVGIAGDGLRGPYMGPGSPREQYPGNAYQVFLAHSDAPEVWDGKRLVSGGKHYGHLEVNVSREADGPWQAVLTPVYVFPLMNKQGGVTGFERRVYDDEVVLTAEP